MKNIVTLSIALSIISCERSPVDKKIEEYCKCAEKLHSMDLYDFEHLGHYTDSISNVLSIEIDSLLSKEHTLKQLKEVARCSGILAEAAYNRKKEFDRKHDFE
ncbi:MAG: hypothetical protein IPP69_14505 [Flavobacteriales bacterium]|nr:hypothetical protein [Flavobacteriales bacterium]